MSDSNSNDGIGDFLYFIASVATGMIGYDVNVINLHSNFPLFWSIMDFFFAPFAWMKWLICQEVTLNLIKNTFHFFFN